MRCSISRSALAAIRAHAVHDAPIEACGLLLGRGDAILEVVGAANVADDPSRRFEIDPSTLIAAFRAERAGRAALLGYYHSHPSGDATPSRTDAGAAAPDGRLWLIVAGEDVTLWRAVEHGSLHGRFDAVEWLACS